MQNKYTVYSLVCPVRNEIRYIGMTGKSLSHRLSGHMNQKGNLLKYCWIQWLKQKNLKPIIEEMFVYRSGNSAYNKEQEVIKEYTNKTTLLNLGQGYRGKLNKNKIPYLIKQFDSDDLKISPFDAVYQNKTLKFLRKHKLQTKLKNRKELKK